MIASTAVLAADLPCARAAAQRPIPVLAYHRFDPQAARSATVVTTPVLEAQLAWLAARHYRVVPLPAVVAALRGDGPVIDGPAVAITVDDGFRSVYTEMFPLIRRDRIAVTLFINPPAISSGHAYLTWAQIDEMRQSGLVAVQPHTLSHPDFRVERARRAPADFQAFVARELAGSRAQLEARFGTRADILAWPYGIHDAELESAAAHAGYVAAFALGSRAAAPGSDPFALPRYQIYDSDRGARFAAIAEGMPRLAARPAPPQPPGR
ncbi:polysaccharide deacetylase family protein [Limobrevibacterium gyesilva]|uniref:polysaccharide deacetylase family protein n=1 Tax=Limobrevibacterium gyesilva TaxID=2991712 RepID=UPI0022261E06